MSMTHMLLTELNQMPSLTLETNGSRVDISHEGETLATLHQERGQLDIVVPGPFLPILLAKFPAAKRTKSGLTVDLEDSAAVGAAASLVRMRIDEVRFGWQFSHRGP